MTLRTGLVLATAVLLVAACQPVVVAPSAAASVPPGEIETPGPTPTEVAVASGQPTLGVLDQVTSVVMLEDGRILVGGARGHTAFVAYQMPDGWHASQLVGPIVTSLSAAGEDRAKAGACVPRSPADLCVPLVASSPDYGAAWTHAAGPSVAMASGDVPALRISFADEAHGFAVVPNAMDNVTHLFITSDGGTHWRSVDHVCPGTWTVEAVARATATTGWIACTGERGAGEEAKAIRRTDDGGGTWRTVAMVDPVTNVRVGSIDVGGYLDGIAATADGHLWSWSDRGVLQGSSDGGATWMALGLGSPDVATVLSASLLDAGHGVALLDDANTDAALLEQTTDGGRTWQVLATFPRG